MRPDQDDIQRVVHLYFRSYLEADADGLAQAFYPDTRLFAVDQEMLDETPLGDWLTRIRARRAKGDLRQAETRIDLVDIAGDAAAVKATLVFPEFRFTDYLSLLRIGGAWRIVGKIYALEKNAAS